MAYSPERSTLLRAGIATGTAITLAGTAFYAANETTQPTAEHKTRVNRAVDLQKLGALPLDACTRFSFDGCEIVPAPEPTPSRMTLKPEKKLAKQKEQAVPQSTAAQTARENRTQERSSRSQRDNPDIDNRSLYEKFEALAECESGGDWDINTGNGYYGGIQFADATWDSIGGGRYASRADLATKDQQIAMGIELYRQSGDEQWPVCGDRAGL